ncbi:hypothetical protein HDV01_002412 [Terramyces sp. JEL0728]|nr:hypothetical protein HDV01_002412 [Terramyces sp. JEL0728]
MTDIKPGSIPSLKRHSGPIAYPTDRDIGIKFPRTSTSHPLNISWILNENDQKRVDDSEETLIPQIIHRNAAHETQLREEFEIEEALGLPSATKLPAIKLSHGNFALSSCPGKKVRLATGPTRGKAMIARDLDLDFQRIARLNIKTIICKAAKRNNIHVVRYPIVEGCAPDSVKDIDNLLVDLDRNSPANSNVLCHCRGGILN